MRPQAKLKTVFVTSEAVPFAKTGGLADVGGALPTALSLLGLDVATFLPLYRHARAARTELQKLDVSFPVPVGEKEIPVSLWKGRLPGSDVTYYFIQSDPHFDRPQLYGEKGKDYPDNAERFILFSRAVVESFDRLGMAPDVIHCNDWQTGFVSVYSRTLYANRPCCRRAALVHTVHNLAYQGVFPAETMRLTGLDPSLFNPKQLEFYGSVNFMKAGLVFADWLSTVSPTYASQIQSPEFGVGLDGVLRERAGTLTGITNGVDYAIWSPEADRFIAANYSTSDCSGKARCKRALQESCGLAVGKAPLIGMISRLADQKGLDLLAEALPPILALGVQMAILGTGDPKYHTLLRSIERRFRRQVSVNLAFNDPLAHEIEAGSDMYLMPSRFEPCGLNQLYSLRYGTVPIVHHTGGLADTVVDFNEKKLEDGSATGFVFRTYSPAELAYAVLRAAAIYNDSEAWRRLMLNGMKQDWSWHQSARAYLKLYQRALELRKTA